MYEPTPKMIDLLQQGVDPKIRLCGICRRLFNTRSDIELKYTEKIEKNPCCEFVDGQQVNLDMCCNCDIDQKQFIADNPEDVIQMESKSDRISRN